MVERLNAMLVDIRDSDVADTAVLACFYKLGYLLDEQAFVSARSRHRRPPGGRHRIRRRLSRIARGRSPSRYNAVGSLKHAESRASAWSRCIIRAFAGNREIGQVAAAVRKTYRNANRLS